MRSGKFIALWIVLILLLVMGVERPALLASGMTEGAIWICLIGVALFIYWLGVLYDNNGK
jgi:hypothetical protein